MSLPQVIQSVVYDCIRKFHYIFDYLLVSRPATDSQSGVPFQTRFPCRRYTLCSLRLHPKIFSHFNDWVSSPASPATDCQSGVPFQTRVLCQSYTNCSLRLHPKTPLYFERFSRPASPATDSQTEVPFETRFPCQRYTNCSPRLYLKMPSHFLCFSSPASPATDSKSWVPFRIRFPCQRYTNCFTTASENAIPFEMVPFQPGLPRTPKAGSPSNLDILAGVIQAVVYDCFRNWHHMLNDFSVQPAQPRTLKAGLTSKLDGLAQAVQTVVCDCIQASLPSHDPPKRGPLPNQIFSAKSYKL